MFPNYSFNRRRKNIKGKDKGKGKRKGDNIHPRFDHRSSQVRCSLRLEGGWTIPTIEILQPPTAPASLLLPGELLLEPGEDLGREVGDYNVGSGPVTKQGGTHRGK